MSVGDSSEKFGIRCFQRLQGEPMSMMYIIREFKDEGVSTPPSYSKSNIIH